MGTRFKGRDTLTSKNELCWSASRLLGPGQNAALEDTTKTRASHALHPCERKYLSADTRTVVVIEQRRWTPLSLKWPLLIESMCDKNANGTGEEATENNEEKNSTERVKSWMLQRRTRADPLTWTATESGFSRRCLNMPNRTKSLQKRAKSSPRLWKPWTD